MCIREACWDPEYHVQNCINEDARYKTVKPVEIVKMFEASCDVNIGYSGAAHVVQQAGEVWREGEEKRDESTLIDTIPVIISSIWVV